MNFIPNLIAFFSLILVLIFFVTTSISLLGAAGFWCHVAFDNFRRFWFWHSLPTDYLEARAAIQPHHDVFVAAAIRAESQIRTGTKLSRRLGRNAIVFIGKFSGGLKNIVRHYVPRLNPAFGAVLVMRLNAQP